MDGIAVKNWSAHVIGFYQTSHPVRKSNKFSKFRLSGNQMFSFPDTSVLKVEKNPFFYLFIFFLFGKMFKNISPDSVQSRRICPAILGVWSCTVRKLSPVWSSPTIWGLSLNPMDVFYLHCLKWFVRWNVLFGSKLRPHVSKTNITVPSMYKEVHG